MRDANFELDRELHPDSIERSWSQLMMLFQVSWLFSDILPVWRIHEILVRIRIRRSILRLTTGFADSDPDPAIFVSDLQGVKKKILSFFASYFLKVHIKLFFKDFLTIFA